MDVPDSDDCAIVGQDYAAAPKPIVDIEFLSLILADRHNQCSAARRALNVRVGKNCFEQSRPDAALLAPLACMTCRVDR
ncbi:MAG: hypothetical protein A3D16_20565 [Rhodobacterales bacterium RIFCSPHIGHO2_02_FULL_62_130]|nr:MAG: hypothetical protein A3D16_20565 [Rhodobacterales bacterium RIFCSPHIGHO2_02_FULL_62_130]OHC59569.1 MAG: hypothetical protein A3E48_01045 [Rhodobacterales bacterium RIFCSPHIGHO2_12_FULL_62_75]HCZ00213.1 hypothetical protein [Rhodobacter sp.]